MSNQFRPRAAWGLLILGLGVGCNYCVKVGVRIRSFVCPLAIVNGGDSTASRSELRDSSSGC
jgi:hypothetical protein